MKTDSAQHLLEIDLTAALQAFHNGKSEGRSLEAEQWMKLYELAVRLGYNVTSHWEYEKSSVALVTARNSGGDKDLEEDWTRKRQQYKDYRARSHNDVHPEHVEKWCPNLDDSRVMKELGICWETTQKSEKTVPVGPLASPVPRRTRSGRQAKQ